MPNPNENGPSDGTSNSELSETARRFVTDYIVGAGRMDHDAQSEADWQARFLEAKENVKRFIFDNRIDSDQRDHPIIQEIAVRYNEAKDLFQSGQAQVAYERMDALFNRLAYLPPDVMHALPRVPQPVQPEAPAQNEPEQHVTGGRLPQPHGDRRPPELYDRIPDFEDLRTSRRDWSEATPEEQDQRRRDLRQGFRIALGGLLGNADQAGIQKDPLNVAKQNEFLDEWETIEEMRRTMRSTTLYESKRVTEADILDAMEDLYAETSRLYRFKQRSIERKYFTAAYRNWLFTFNTSSVQQDIKYADHGILAELDAKLAELDHAARERWYDFDFERGIIQADAIIERAKREIASRPPPKPAPPPPPLPPISKKKMQALVAESVKFVETTGTHDERPTLEAEFKHVQALLDSDDEEQARIALGSTIAKFTRFRQSVLDARREFAETAVSCTAGQNPSRALDFLNIALGDQVRTFDDLVEVDQAPTSSQPGIFGICTFQPIIPFVGSAKVCTFAGTDWHQRGKTFSCDCIYGGTVST